MDVRDYFAAHCPYVYYASPGEIMDTLKLPPEAYDNLTYEHTLEYYAVKRYQYADMMLKVRERTRE